MPVVAQAAGSPSPETEGRSGDGEKADEIAALVMGRFGELARKRKPAVRDTGVREWTTLSGIVAERDGELRCVCLATGVKCLPVTKVKVARGNGIHDWHAEILAIRAFNHFLLSECRALAEVDESADYESFIVQRAPGGSKQPFEIRGDVTLYMYASEAPCGDASMELTMSEQEDPTPWTAPSPAAPSDPATASPSLPGREYFSQLGIVRRKPSRPDAPPSLSKSCSDKLALRQATSLLSSLTSLLVAPGAAYLSALVVPAPSYVPAAFRRCFVERMAPLKDAMADARGAGDDDDTAGYRYRDLRPMTTSLPFEFSRRGAGGGDDAPAAAPCNVSAVWTPGLDEGLVGGVLQGRRAFEERGASAVSRRRMWGFAREVAGMLPGGGGAIGEALAAGRYGGVKEGRLLGERRWVKGEAREGALKGWVRNTGDEEFGLDGG